MITNNNIGIISSIRIRTIHIISIIIEFVYNCNQLIYIYVVIKNILLIIIK